MQLNHSSDGHTHNAHPRAYLNFPFAFALPRRVSTRTVFWECDELNNCGFALPGLCLEKLTCSLVSRTAVESSKSEIFQEWNSAGA
jgi:hypothetical protein